MHYLFEETHSLNTAAECFCCNAKRDSFPIRPHWHYFMEIILMLSGNAELNAGSESFRAAAGDMILFHPKAVHSIYAPEGTPPEYAVIKLDISRMNMTADYIPKLRSIFRAAEKKGMNIFFTAAQTSRMGAEEIMERCIDEMKSRRYGFDLVVRSELCRLLINILRCWQEQGFTVDSEVFAEDSRYDIYNITEFIDENMSRGVKVAEVAELCGMSYSYFAKTFLSVYGKSCKEYMEEMRVFKAEELLAFTDFDLSYISQETGFSDCSHMIKSFRARRGITPKQFRMKHKSLGNKPL